MLEGDRDKASSPTLAAQGWGTLGIVMEKSKTSKAGPLVRGERTRAGETAGPRFVSAKSLEGEARAEFSAECARNRRAAGVDVTNGLLERGGEIAQVAVEVVAK